MTHALERFRLDGRRALITGSGRGIGLTLARGLAEAGAAIVINDRNEEKAAALVRHLREEGFTADYAVFDVAEHAQVRAAIDDFEARVGAIDILVNNAGIQRRAPLDAFEPDDWHALMRVNLDGVFNVAQAVARHMIARGRGKIINICSVQSETARPTIAPYAATKGAVRMLTKGMCADWARHGIRRTASRPAISKPNSTARWSTTRRSRTGCASARRPAAGGASTSCAARRSSSRRPHPIS